MGEAFNGNEPSTHTFVVTYEGAAEIDETLSILNFTQVSTNNTRKPAKQI
jgi:hypothetical protein